MEIETYDWLLSHARDRLQVSQTGHARAAAAVERWRERSALTDEPVPGPVREVHLSNIDPAEYSKTDALRFYPLSDWTDEIPRKFEDFVLNVREILRQTNSGLSMSYFKPHDYVVLTASGYVLLLNRIRFLRPEKDCLLGTCFKRSSTTSDRLT
jgi:hypothetical protein